MIILNNHKIINSLKSNGFTEYEAKIYIALLKRSPANGNMIATASGVPSPKVYETLRKMQEKGYVFPVSNGEKNSNKWYIPLPYQDLLDSFEKEFFANLTLLNSTFNEIYNTSNQNWSELFHIAGYETSIEAIKNEIENSNLEISMSCWSEEFNKLYPYLLAAHERGVKIVVLLFDDKIDNVPWRSFYHNNRLEKMINKRHKGELNIVIDQKKAIIFDAENNPHAVVSSHQAMVATTIKYIRHDIYVNRIMNDFGEKLEDFYGKNYEGLINDF